MNRNTLKLHTSTTVIQRIKNSHNGAKVNFSRPFTPANDSSIHAPDAPQQPETSISLSKGIPKTFDEISPRLHSHSMVTLSAIFNQSTMDKSADDVLHEPTSNHPLVPEEDANEEVEAHLAALGTSQPSFSQQLLIPKKPRYYPNNLSEEDKRALAVGELNHNLKEWMPNDLIRFHEGRLSLVHVGLENRGELLYSRLMEMQNGKQYVAQYKKRNEQVRQYLRGSPITIATTVFPAAKSLKNTQIGKHIRAPSASMAPVSRRPPSSPLSAVLPASEIAQVLFQETRILPPAETCLHTQARAANSYAAQSQHRPESYHVSISTSLQRSWPISSPLNTIDSEAPEVRPHESKPDVSFDSFLAPHISGKGEAFRGAENAKKEEATDDKMEDDEKIGKLGGSCKNPVRRLSKMASWPSLRLKKSEMVAGNRPE